MYKSNFYARGNRDMNMLKKSVLMVGITAVFLTG